MGFLSSVFGNAQQSAPQAAPQQDAGQMGFSTPSNNAASSNNQGASMPPMQNGQPSPDNQQAASPQKPIDPMDKFSKLWDNPSNTEEAPKYSIDDKVLGEVADSQDFMRGADADLMQRATNGDVKALMELMNNVGRNAYKASLQHGGKLNESFVGARDKFNEQGFSKKVGRELTVNALTGTPNFQNPVVRKQLIKIAESMQVQHPDAAPEEIAQMSKEYITELSNAINPQSKQQAAAPAGSVNWDTWFDQ